MESEKLVWRTSFYLELVGRVERNLTDLLVLGSVVHDIALRKLSAFEDGSL